MTITEMEIGDELRQKNDDQKGKGKLKNFITLGAIALTTFVVLGMVTKNIERH